MINVALVVHACDKYKLLFKGFEYFFEKNWDNRIPCNLYFTYEVEQPQLNLFKTICTGTGHWTFRLKKALNQIEEDYIVFFQEDFWLKTPTDALFFNQLFDYVIKNRTDLIKLHHTSGYYIKNKINRIGNHPVYEIDKERSDYLLSHQISIWKKSFFISLLQKKENPWQNEMWGSERIKKMNTAVYGINYFRCNENIASTSVCQYYTVSNHAKLNPYLEHFLEELSEEKEFSAYYSKLNNHYNNGWTHDKDSEPSTLSFWDRMRLKMSR